MITSILARNITANNHVLFVHRLVKYIGIDKLTFKLRYLLVSLCVGMNMFYLIRDNTIDILSYQMVKLRSLKGILKFYRF